MNKYLKKYWGEEGITYYLHFQNGYAVRQIEVHQDKVIHLSINEPEQAAMMSDQPLEILEVDDEDFITEELFEEKWNER